MALSAVMRKPFASFSIQSTTTELRSDTLLTSMSISTDMPPRFTSCIKGLKSITAFAPFFSTRASPSQPLVCQSTPSKVVPCSP